MRNTNLMRLSLQNLRRNRKRVILSSLGMIIGIATLIFFFALTSGARVLILEKVLSRLPANQVKLNPDYGKSFGQEKDRIDQETVDRLRKIEGVRQIFGLRQIEADCHLVGQVSGSSADTAYTKIGIATYDTSYFQDDLPEGVEWTWNEQSEAVPLLINPTMLVSWNEIFSNRFGAPKLTLETISSIPLTMRIYHPQTSGSLEYSVKIVGQTAQAPIFAPLVPEEFVNAMNDWAIGEDAPRTYSSLVVELENPGLVDTFVQQVRKFGLAASSDKRVAEMIETGINVLTIFLSSISLVIVLVSLINVFNIFLVNVMERRYEIGLMRSVGARRSDIRMLILGESAFIGLVNGLVGIAIGIIAILALNPFFSPLTVEYFGFEEPFLPLNFQLMLIILLASPVVTVLAVFQPANYAARLDPVEALRK